MTTISNMLILIIAVVHILFAAMEFFVRTRHKLFDLLDIKITDAAEFRQAGRIIINSAAFNLMIGLGLIVSVIGSADQVLWLKIYLLFLIIVAGIVGGLTLGPIVAKIQSVPAAIALVVLWLAQ